MTAPAYDVLRNITRADIRRDPYPYVVVEDCLPPEIYDELARTYPDDETILRLSGARDQDVIRQNHRYDLRAHRILRNPNSVSPAWQDFVRYHVSPEFFREFLNLFGPDIASIYPDAGTEAGADHAGMDDGDPVRSGMGSRTDRAGLSIGINTPVKRRSSTRGVHTDAPDELFAMLLYFRRDDDRSRGGDLEICQWKKGAPHLFVDRNVDTSDTERRAIIPYKANTLVIFINSTVSLHGVTPRDPTPLSRRLVNIVGRVQRSVPEGLFERPQKKGLKPWRDVSPSRHTAV